MNRKSAPSARAPLFLGIEGGGTRTVALLVDAQERLVRRIETGPANLRLLTDDKLVSQLRSLGSRPPEITSVAVGLAGARTEADRERIRRAAGRVWPGIPCHATNDLETALMAAENSAFYVPRSVSNTARVLVLSGTGSCCFGRTWNGRTAKVGGWGHVLGDKGSGFEIGLRALKAVVYYYDCDGVWSKLGQRLLRKLQLNEPDDLIGWIQKAGKDEVAALAVEVFGAQAGGDRIAIDILEGAAHGLANDAVACARRLVKSEEPVQFVLAGGVLLRQPRFARKVAGLLRKLWPKAVVTPLQRESVWGAVELAKQLVGSSRRKKAHFSKSEIRNPKSEINHEPQLPSLESLKLSPTERRNPRSMNLDKLSIADAILLMLGEDKKIPAAILVERKKIERAVNWIVRAFRHGGRLFYVGAGTSGRLGVLDASECPPTFRTPPDLVQGIVAGGRRALWEAVEGAEDDPLAGARVIQFRDAGRKDVVVGIAASGRTPFVWGALGEARKRGAKTVLVCFNPNLEIPRRNRPDLVIAPNVGTELLTGSTRLKSGTATKLILNMFTTLAMVQMGKVVSNLMVDVNPSNVKLRDRAVRIVRDLTGVDDATARQGLENARWIVKDACWRLQRRRR
ncbi:MAG TPA: N-acetylmuramic acid 6-phosphate etherase [Verrucomicrobiae bacterium]|nr:N-acetylmuramic acid 6-phosphate etherase [Verrucomicrobiae bacterium]